MGTPKKEMRIKKKPPDVEESSGPPFIGRLASFRNKSEATAKLFTKRFDISM
jgi:hypothetical protein